MPAWLRDSRSIARAAIALGVVLALPALAGGFFIDDHLLIANLEGWAPVRTSPLDLYRFVPLDRATFAALIDRGGLPWWSAEDLRIGFLRPLASGLIALEHALWGRQLLLYHVHSLAWLLALLATVAALARRLAAPAIAALVTLLFACEDSHAMSIGWVAGRQAMIATGLAWLGFLAHLRWREEGWRAGAWLAPLGFAAGLAAGETALAALAYVAAWELVTRRTGWQRALLPLVAVGGLYLVAHGLAGAGTGGSGGYLDPRAQPGAFLRALPGRLLLFVANLVFGVPADLVLMDARLHGPLVALGAGALVLVIVVLRKVWPTLAGDERRIAAALGAGALLSLLPGVGALPGERVLMPATFGVAYLFALILRAGLAWWRAPRSRLRGGVILALFGLPNLVIAPLARVAKVAALGDMTATTRRIAAESEADAPGPADVFILNAEDLQVAYLSLTRVFYAGGDPAALAARVRAAPGFWPDVTDIPGATRSWFVLSMAATEHVVRSKSAHAFELATPRGTFFDGSWPPVYRPAGRPMPAGTRVELDGFRVTVLAADAEGRPTRIEVASERPLDDPRVRILAWKDGAFRRFALPAIGAEARVPRGPPFYPPQR